MHRYSVLIVLLTTALAAACSTPATDTPSAGAAPTAAAAPQTAVHDGRAIEITAADTMKFSVTEITAKRGEKLSVTLVNLGTTPKFSMGHNWVLVAAGTDLTSFLSAAAEAVTADFVPAAQKDRIVAATKLLGPNERDVVTFTAPTAPGRYDFFCSFPGHFQVGMRGVLIVE